MSSPVRPCAASPPRETLEEARAMAADAIEGYLELLREDGLPLPASDEPSAGPFRDRVTIKLQTG